MLTLLSLPLASEFPCVNLISDLSQCPLGEQEIYYFGIPLNTTQRKRERNKKQKISKILILQICQSKIV